MFERYTAEARRAVFFGRYEAAVRGRREIDPEHCLAGILKADPELAQALIPFRLNLETIRDKMDQNQPATADASATPDLPVSAALKRVMAYAAEEANRSGLQDIGTACLLLGIGREEDCAAARMLSDAGLDLTKLRALLPQQRSATGRVEMPAEGAHAATAEEIPPYKFRDLTQAAQNGMLAPLIGREAELARMIEILSRRTKKNAVLIGEPGVGKTALVEGLAQQFAHGRTPGFSDHRVWMTEATSLFPVKPGRQPELSLDKILDNLVERNTLLCIEGLFDLATARSDWGVMEAAHILEPGLLRGQPYGAPQCVATGTPRGLARTLEVAPALARLFEVITIAPPDPTEAVNILQGLKTRYQEFHGVSYGPGAIEMCVYASGRFLAHRSLPDRAFDLLDEAGARVKVRREAEPADVVNARRRIRQHARNLEDAIRRHDFATARAQSELESAERARLRDLLQDRRAEAANRTVTPADVEDAVAERVDVPVSLVRAILAQKGPAELDQTLKELATRIPIHSNEWIACLAAFILRSSDEDVEALIAGIRAARDGIRN